MRLPGPAIGQTPVMSFTPAGEPPPFGDPTAPTGPVRIVRPPRRRRRVGALLGLGGIVVTIAGTFLPWLTSGQVNRNSYAVAGLADRLLVEPGSVTSLALGAWPFVGPALLISVVLAALGLWRTAAMAASAVAVLIGGLAAVALSAGGSADLVRLNLLGPVVTLGGALLTIAGGVVVLTVRRGPSS